MKTTQSVQLTTSAITGLPSEHATHSVAADRDGLDEPKGHSQLARCRGDTKAVDQFRSFGADVSLLSEVRQQLGQLRGWRSADKAQLIRVNWQSQEGLLKAELECLQPRSASHAFDSALGALGFLPLGFNSRDQMLAQFHAETRGLYLTTLSTIAVSESLSDEALRSSLFHESAHAYQDSLYRLGEHLAYRPGRSDRIAAYHSLAEGEALYLELTTERATATQAIASPEQINALLEQASLRVALPRVLQRSLVAPYVDGYRFVTYLMRSGGWQLVERVWARGLASTSELLHPERWVFDGLQPIGVPAPAARGLNAARAPGGDRSPEVDEPLGEQALRVMLQAAGQSPERVRTVTDGYVEDRLTSYSRQSQQTDVAWRVRFGSERIAKEAFRILEAALAPGAAGHSSCRRQLDALVSMWVIGRDILVLGRAQADTVAAADRTLDCQFLENWFRDLFAER